MNSINDREYQEFERSVAKNPSLAKLVFSLSKEQANALTDILSAIRTGDPAMDIVRKIEDGHSMSGKELVALCEGFLKAWAADHGSSLEQLKARTQG